MGYKKGHIEFHCLPGCRQWAEAPQAPRGWRARAASGQCSPRCGPCAHGWGRSLLWWKNQGRVSAHEAPGSWRRSWDRTTGFWSLTLHLEAPLRVGCEPRLPRRVPSPSAPGSPCLLLSPLLPVAPTLHREGPLQTCRSGCSWGGHLAAPPCEAQRSGAL